MTPTLIVLVLLAVAVAIVAWATRRKPARPYEERLEQDTAWNDPVTPGAGADPAASAQVTELSSPHADHAAPEADVDAHAESSAAEPTPDHGTPESSRP